jgi:hypothetical protein
MSNPNFTPNYSTDEIYRGNDMDRCLSDDLEALETGKAAANHTHSYNDLSDKPTIPSIPASLPANGGNADTVDGKHASDFANASHSHSGYSVTGHTHSYNDLDNKPTIPTSLPANGGNADTVDGKHATDFASADHTHVIYGGNGASTYKKVWIATNGSDNNVGTAAAPMATITGAIRKYSPKYKMLDISLADGTYNENLGAISPDLSNLAIRSNSEDRDKVTINMTTALEVNVNILRLYNITLSVADTCIRPISVTGGHLYAYGCKISVPEASGSSCVNVYNGCTAFLMNCVLNAGTGTNGGAALYGNQALRIVGINCTSERTIGIGFYAHNGTYIEYTPTVTAAQMIKETYYGKCVAR